MLQEVFNMIIGMPCGCNIIVKRIKNEVTIKNIIECGTPECGTFEKETIEAVGG